MAQAASPSWTYVAAPLPAGAAGSELSSVSCPDPADLRRGRRQPRREFRRLLVPRVFRSAARRAVGGATAGHGRPDAGRSGLLLVLGVLHGCGHDPRRRTAHPRGCPVLERALVVLHACARLGRGPLQRLLPVSLPLRRGGSPGTVVQFLPATVLRSRGDVERPAVVHFAAHGTRLVVRHEQLSDVRLLCERALLRDGRNGRGRTGRCLVLRRSDVEPSAAPPTRTSPSHCRRCRALTLRAAKWSALSASPGLPSSPRTGSSSAG